ncbi:MAG TPA: TetR/AcrR family transcriptional regulator [Steroidobacteraceae bacterium]
MTARTRTAQEHAAPAGGRIRQKQRTRRDLLATAGRLIAEGRHPTVTEVADAAGVSRRTAYRYFPAQQKMLVEAALEGVRPEVEAAIGAAPPGRTVAEMEQRLDVLVRAVQELAVRNEHRLRTMIYLTVLEQPLPGMRARGSRRIEWIELAVAPLKPRLGKATYARLVSALALIVGIEALVVLRDLRGLSEAQALQASQWMARAVLHEALREAAAA